MLFGGGFMMKIGPLAVGSNRTSPNQDQSLNNYFSDLENNKSASEGAVKVFHTQVGQGQCKEIYDQASEMLKKNQTQERLISFCTQLKENFGEVKTTQLIDWWVRPGESVADNIFFCGMRRSTRKSLHPRLARPLCGWSKTGSRA
jgi:hypothetical protein